MRRHIHATAIASLCLIGVSESARGATNECCNLALQTQAFLRDPSIPLNRYVCNQTIAAGSAQAPAADLTVPLAWCQEHCSKYELYKPGETSDWAIPLVAFILPAVIFSTQIPRRLVLRPPAWPTGRWRKWTALPLFLYTCLLIVLDTMIWVFAIMILSGPLILGGLVEMLLDFKTIGFLRRRQCVHALSPAEEVEQIDALMTIVAGNLRIDGEMTVDPIQELRAELSQNGNREEVVNSLRMMMESQNSFGGFVGAAILLYLGSYVLTVSNLSTTEGDEATARALAFGIWWMTIVHVSVVGGSLLASNNPSAAAAIVGRLPRKAPTDTAGSGLISRFFNRIRRILLANSLLNYETRYEPAWMWARGQNKTLWLKTISQTHDGLATPLWDNVKISNLELLALTTTSYSLVFVPCALAFWIEYRTPPVTVGCRSLTILLYMVTQTIFIIASALTHHTTFRLKLPSLSHPRTRLQSLRRFLTLAILGPTTLLAIFTTFAGTLMQITGIFQNCRCAATYAWVFRVESTVALATDTLAERESSGSWNRAGYAALSVLAFVTVCGWLCQRGGREGFRRCVDGLWDGHEDYDDDDDDDDDDEKA